MFRQSLILAATSLAAAVALPAQVQQSRPTMLGDAERFHGAEWEVVPLVRLDSSKTADTMAIRQLGDVAVLGPRRYVYAGQLTNGKKWALFSVLDGTTTRLGVDDREFMTDGRKTKMWIGARLRIVTFGGRALGWFAVGQRLPNAIWTTDGTTWKPFLREGDTLRVGGEALVVSAFAGGSADSSGGLLLNITSKTPKFSGIVRFTSSGVEKVLAEGDSLPGVTSLKLFGASVFGLMSGLKALEPTRTGWVALVRNDHGGRRYQDVVIARDSAGAMKVIAQSDTFGIREGRDSIGTRMFPSPAGDVLLQRGQVVGIATSTGEWKPLAGPEQMLPHKDGHELSEAHWLDGRSRVLFAVTLAKTQVSSTTSGVSVYRTSSMTPLLFYHDGTRTTAVRPDSTFQPNVFTNFAASTTLARVPGYDDVTVRQRFTGDSSWVFVPATTRFVPSPAFRTADGGTSVRAIIAWEGPSEALVRSGGGLALLRRRP